MTEQKLSPCPDCGGECVVKHITVMGFNFYATYHPNLPDGKLPSCPFSVQATTKEQAIALHEHLSGVCRWRKEFPDEQCYWWWVADDESGPLVVKFLWSGTTKNYFASMGQLGWKECRNREWFEKHHPNSRWMKIEEPPHPNCGKKVEVVE